MSNEYTLNDALELARMYQHAPGQTPSGAPLPSVDEAIAIIRPRLKEANFNWLTGKAAMEVLEAAKKNGGSYASRTPEEGV